MAFEAGNVECRAFRPTDGKTNSIEGIGWERLWNVRFHPESGSFPYSRSMALVPPGWRLAMTNQIPCPVMAMVVSRDSTLALSVSADHLVGRYDLTVGVQAHSLEHIR